MPQDAEIVATPGIIPEGFCPINEQQRYNQYIDSTTFVLPGNFSSFNFGPDQPTVDNQSKPWIKTTSAGALVGIFTFYSGAWVRPHPVPASSDVRMMWVGTTAALQTFDGGAAGAVTELSGPTWEVDTAYADKIPVGAGGTAVATNASELSSGASATDQVRGTYFIKRTARVYYTA